MHLGNRFSYKTHSCKDTTGRVNKRKLISVFQNWMIILYLFYHCSRENNNDGTVLTFLLALGPGIAFSWNSLGSGLASRGIIVSF